MTEQIVYDNNGLPVIVDDGQGTPDKPRFGQAGSTRPQRDEPRRRRSGNDAIAMFARRPLVGIKKIKPEDEELVLDETIPPIRKFGYAPQAILLTNEGSIYTARMRTEMQISNDAVIGTIPSSPVVLWFPSPPAQPDLVFKLEKPFLSGIILRLKLFASWQGAPIRDFIEVTIYTQNPLPFIAAGTPIPRNIILYEMFTHPLPVPYTPANTYESVIDEAIDIPYELQYDSQSSGRTGQGTQVIIPQLFIRVSPWMDPYTQILWDWRIQFEDGGR